MAKHQVAEIDETELDEMARNLQWDEERDAEEKILEAEQAAEVRNTQSILIDLRDFLDSVSPAERAGMIAAIEIIEANYRH